jgi:hypothetical protein
VTPLSFRAFCGGLVDVCRGVVVFVGGARLRALRAAKAKLGGGPVSPLSFRAGCGGLVVVCRGVVVFVGGGGTLRFLRIGDRERLSGVTGRSCRGSRGAVRLDIRGRVERVGGCSLVSPPCDASRTVSQTLPPFSRCCLYRCFNSSIRLCATLFSTRVMIPTARSSASTSSGLDNLDCLVATISSVKRFAASLDRGGSATCAAIVASNPAPEPSSCSYHSMVRALATLPPLALALAPRLA